MPSRRRPAPVLPVHASNIAARVAAAPGFGEILIPILIPIATHLVTDLLSCLANRFSGADPQAVLESHRVGEGWDPNFVESLRPQLRAAVIKANRGLRPRERTRFNRLTEEQKDAITIESLNEGIHPETNLAACSAEARAA